MSENHIIVPSQIGMGYFGMSFEAGGVWEGADTGRGRGTSHLMEHLMCKPLDRLLPKMRELGIDFNASTGGNQVIIYASGLSENLNSFAQEMVDETFYQQNLCTKERFESEKSTVLQEYDMSWNSQFQGTWGNFTRKYYGYCGPIGFRKDIEEFMYDDFLEHAKKYFKHPNKICEVLHDSDRVRVPNSMEYTSNEYPTKVQFGEYDIELEKVPKEEQTVTMMLSKDTFSVQEAAKLGVIASCLGDGLESPLFQELRERRGLVYSLFAFPYVIGDSVIPLVGTQSSNEKAQEVNDVLRDFFGKEMSKHITPERFSICKGAVVSKEKRSKILPHSGVTQLYLSDYNPFEGIDTFTYEEAIALANKAFTNETLHLDSY